MEDNRYMTAALKKFQWSINNAFTILEPCDHGGRFYKAKLQKIAAEFIRESLEMAARAAYTREEFEAWLESGNAIKSPVA